MRFWLLAAFVPFLLIAESVCAEDSIPEGSGEQIKVFSPLLAGMMGGAICNKNIDRQRAAQYVAEELGAETKFKIDQVVFLTWMAYAQQAMQAELGAVPSKPNRQYCRTLMNAFGPEGTQVKGLLTD